MLELYVVVCRGLSPNFYAIGPRTDDLDVRESDAAHFYETLVNEQDALAKHNWLRRARGRGGRDG